MASGRVRLFVYGSLKRGGRHHDELRAVGATFLGEGATLPGYRLEALDATEEYVALLPPETDTERVAPGRRPTAGTASDVVCGELFEVPESGLPALDAFEGDGYTRSILKVRRLTATKGQHEAPHQDEDQVVPFEDSLAYFKKAR